MKEKIKSWWNAKSEMATAILGDGDTFTHGEVVLTNLGLLAFFLLIGFIEGMKGGTAW